MRERSNALLAEVTQQAYSRIYAVLAEVRPRIINVIRYTKKGAAAQRRQPQLSQQF